MDKSGNNKILKALRLLLYMGIACYTVLSQMLMVLFHQRYAYLYVAQLLFIGIMLFMALKKKLYYVHSLPVNFLLLSFFMSMTSSLRGMELTYVQASVGMLCQFGVLYFITAFIEEEIEESIAERPGKDIGILKVFVLSMKFICLLQVVYIFAQFISYHFFGVYLNRLIFLDILKMDMSGILWPEWSACTGFTYSQPLLAPMFVIGMLLFSNIWIRILFILASFLCRSSTSIVGTSATAFFLLVAAVIDGKFKKENVKRYFAEMKGVKLVLQILTLFLMAAAIFFSGVFDKALEEAKYLYTRIFLSGGTEVHISYFSSVRTVLPEMGIYNLLFGYGNNCSGYPMNQFIHGGEEFFPVPSIVECDYIDTLFSRGIFGFAVTYGLLIFLAVKGFKTDKRYTVAAAAFLLMAAGYNIQWHYAMLFVFVLLLCLKHKSDIFEYSDRGQKLLSGKK